MHDNSSGSTLDKLAIRADVVEDPLLGNRPFILDECLEILSSVD